MSSFTVTDMTCDGCVKAITAAVRRVSPAATVHADLVTKQVDIRSDAAAETIAEAMREAGFTPVARAA